MVDYHVYVKGSTKYRVFHSIADVEDYCINKATLSNEATEAYRIGVTKKGSYKKLVRKCTPGPKNKWGRTYKMVSY